MTDIENTIQKIIMLNQDEQNYKRRLDFKGGPAQGQFVVTGYQLGGASYKMVGYCVQVRKNSGQFGSDMIFLRHFDGRLVTHENQSFYSLTEEQEILARSIFKVLPEEEDYSFGYKCCEGINEVGFIIEKSATKGSPNTPFTISIKNEDGTTEISTYI